MQRHESTQSSASSRRRPHESLAEAPTVMLPARRPAGAQWLVADNALHENSGATVLVAVNVLTVLSGTALLLATAALIAIVVMFAIVGGFLKANRQNQRRSRW